MNRDDKIVKARDYFLSGYNCAQAVVAAYAEEMRLSEKDALLLASGLGGGLGGMRQVCGAVNGMCIVAGKLLGYDEADATDEKKHLYALVKALIARFTESYGTINCGELLKLSGVFAKSEPSERTPEYYRTRPCVRYVMDCAGFLADILKEENA